MAVKTCAGCGNQNQDEARFCVHCGASLAEAPAAEAGAAADVAPGASTGEPASPPPPPGQGYAAPPPPAAGTTWPRPGAASAVAHPPSTITGGKKRGAAFWVGAGVVLISGILILMSSFLPWISDPFGITSYSGMDFVTNEWMRMDNLFFDYGDGYPFFSGLTSLILGILVAILAVIMLAARAKWPAGLALLFCLLSLGVAVTNLSSILRLELRAVSGIYVFVVFSVLGMVGSAAALSG